MAATKAAVGRGVRRQLNRALGRAWEQWAGFVAFRSTFERFALRFTQRELGRAWSKWVSDAEAALAAALKRGDSAQIAAATEAVRREKAQTTAAG